MAAIDAKRSRIWAEEFGDGECWYRGSMIGRGNFSHVFMAIRKSTKYTKDYPSLMAVKSSHLPLYLNNEETALDKIGNACPFVINKFFRREITCGEGTMYYNLLFEYASGGTLADKINKSRTGLPESEVMSYTYCILRGLLYIHSKGYVHCDLKPENILFVAREDGKTGFTPKIADFGLAEASKSEFDTNKRRKLDDSDYQPSFKGTINYLPPEAVKYGVQDSSSDMWALGCMVLEMLTGKPAWQTDKHLNDKEVLDKIRTEGELPKIPSELSANAQDFIKLCLVRDRKERCGALDLFGHEFALDGMDYYQKSVEVEVQTPAYESIREDVLCYSEEDAGMNDESLNEVDDEASENSDRFESDDEDDMTNNNGLNEVDEASENSDRFESDDEDDMTNNNGLNEVDMVSENGDRYASDDEEDNSYVYASDHGLKANESEVDNVCGSDHDEEIYIDDVNDNGTEVVDDSNEVDLARKGGYQSEIEYDDDEFVDDSEDDEIEVVREHSNEDDMQSESEEDNDED